MTNTINATKLIKRGTLVITKNGIGCIKATISNPFYEEMDYIVDLCLSRGQGTYREDEVERV